MPKQSKPVEGQGGERRWWIRKRDVQPFDSRPACIRGPQTEEAVEVVEASRLAAERDTDQCICGKEHRESRMAGTEAAFDPGEPKGPDCRSVTWKEQAEKNHQAALDRRKEAKETLSRLAAVEQELKERCGCFGLDSREGQRRVCSRHQTLADRVTEAEARARVANAERIEQVRNIGVELAAAERETAEALAAVEQKLAFALSRERVKGETLREVDAKLRAAEALAAKYEQALKRIANMDGRRRVLASDKLRCEPENVPRKLARDALYAHLPDKENE